WFYTCLWPKGNYANRFIDLPLIKTRLIHWINHKYAIDGYLHWGFNWWTEEPFAETTFINDTGGNLLPGGDSWIVYPGYLSSIAPFAWKPCGTASTITPYWKCSR